MKRTDNYQLQVEQTQRYFLTYDQEKLIRKLKLEADAGYLYARMLGKRYRINRQTACVQRQEGEAWQDANTHAEVMTLLDLVGDSREDRWLSMQWKNMQDFGLMFHQDLLEREDPFAMAIQNDKEGFRAVCDGMDAGKLPGGDISAAIELFDGLCIGILFWEGDEEFEPRVRFLWDANAPMYLKYETMHFAVGLLKKRILDAMKTRRA